MPTCWRSLRRSVAGSLTTVAVDDDRAGLDRLEPVDAAQQRALARAGAADDGDDLARLDRERDAVEHGVASPKRLMTSASSTSDMELPFERAAPLRQREADAGSRSTATVR